MLVTGIMPLDSKKRKVYIDNQYAFPLYISELRKYGIVENAELSEDKYEEIIALLTKRVRERILFILDKYDRTEKDLRRKVTEAGYPEVCIDKAIEQLKEYHYIDDRRFAERYAELLHENHGKSRRDIVNKLYEKGVPREIVDDVMSEFEADDTEPILSALAKKHLTPEAFQSLEYLERQKILAYLFRKGFTMESINKVLHSGIEFS